MQAHITDIANKTIPAPKGKKDLLHNNGNTSDIIESILATDAVSQNQLKDFAPYLKGKDLYSTLYNVWYFVRKYIPYQVDPLGYQFVKTPAATWFDAKRGLPSDCKSYSIFIANVLKNLGISAAYRFVAYNNNKDYTHVYVIVPGNTGQYILDACMPNFNEEKPFTKKRDVMTKIYSVSGLGCPPEQDKTTAPNTQSVVEKAKRGVFPALPQKVRKGFSLLNKDVSQLNKGELTLLIARDRVLTEKAIMDKRRGIGNITSERYKDIIDVIDAGLEVVATDAPEEGMVAVLLEKEKGSFHNADKLSGIGPIYDRDVARVGNLKNLKQKIKQTTQQLKTAVQNTKPGQAVTQETQKAQQTIQNTVKKAQKTRAGKILTTAASQAKQGVKAIKTTLDNVKKKVVGEVLEIFLPAAAPYFLYLFINDAAILSKMPEKVRRKRAVQVKIADFITNTIGIDKAQFMGILRNGIMKKFSKSPEAVLSDMFKARVSGIGIAPALIPVIVAAIPFVFKLIEMLAKAFSKKPDVDAKDGIPGEEDTEGTFDPSLPGDIRKSGEGFVVDENEGGEGSYGGGGGGKKSGWS
jgi:hypothetical protein